MNRKKSKTRNSSPGEKKYTKCQEDLFSGINIFSKKNFSLDQCCDVRQSNSKSTKIQEHDYVYGINRSALKSFCISTCVLYITVAFLQMAADENEVNSSADAFGKGEHGDYLAFFIYLLINRK